MIKDITIGQYFPGDTVIHRLDPRAKIILTVVYIVGIFLAKNLWAFLFLIASAAAQYDQHVCARCEYLFSVWKIKVYFEGVVYAIMMIIRITTLLVGTTIILTYTTSPIMLTDGLEQLLAPLAKIKLPVHEFSMMMTIALRFIPTLIEETDKIMSAQKARGADFSNGSLAKRAKALIPILIPLFISAFRRADELATAMECRCYRGGEGRTRMTILKFTAKDFLAFVIFGVFVAGVVLLNMIPCAISL